MRNIKVIYQLCSLFVENLLIGRRISVKYSFDRRRERLEKLTLFRFGSDLIGCRINNQGELSSILTFRILKFIYRLTRGLGQL